MLSPTPKASPLAGAILAAALLLAGCSRSAPIIEPGALNSQPVPTLSAAFVPQAPTQAPVALPTSTPLPTRAPRPAGQAGDPLADPQIVVAPVYEDALSPGWSLEQSSQLTYDPRSQGYVDSGRYAIRADSGRSAGALYFTLAPDAQQIYRRSDVLGLRLRLSGRGEPLQNDALAVAVVGSNAYPYWVANDTSVKLAGRVTDDGPLFSETRLYYLNINQAIPANTWVDVIVWLDDLLYDPDYTYVTGFYLKTDPQVGGTFYVDQVSLLMRSGTSAIGR